MQIDAAKRNRVLRKAVEPHFLGPPIEGATPVFDELLEISDIRSVGPRFPRRLVGETRSPEPFVEIDDGLFGNFERERLRLCRHGDLVWLWFEAIDRALARPCSHRFAQPSSGEPVRPLQQRATAERLAVCNRGVDRARNSPPQATGFRRPVIKATPCGPTCSA